MTRYGKVKREGRHRQSVFGIDCGVPLNAEEISLCF